MSVEAVVSRILAVARLVSGDVHVPEAPPRALNAADLPTFLVLVGKTLERQVNDCDVRVRRLYHLRLYVSPVARGSEGEVEMLCRPFYDAVPAAFDARPWLVIEPDYPEPPEGLRKATLNSDLGLTVMPWGAQDYLGSEWQLETLEEYKRTRASGN